MRTILLIICLLAFLSTALSLLSYYLLYVMNQLDNELSFHFNRKDSILFTVFLFFSAILLMYKDQGLFTPHLIYSTIFLGYLYITAWIDFYTMRVYRIVCFIFCGVGLGSFIISKPSTETIFGIIIYFAFLFILSISNIFGLGDTWIYLSVSFYLVTLNYQEWTIIILLIHNVLSSFLFLSLNVKNLELKKMKMKNEIALAPSIGIATWIMTMLNY